MNRYVSLLLAILPALFLAGCDAPADQVAGGSTSETRTSVVDIQGQVVSNLGAPLPAIIVRARRLGLSDTTDGDGKYQLRADYPGLDDSLDTLDFFRDGRKIHSVPVPTWVVTMETVVLVQREISGMARGLHPEDRVFAVVNGLDSGIVMELENESWNEWHSPLRDYSDTLRRYSGYLWFRYTGALDTFRVAIVVQDTAGRVSGVSDLLSFTSRRGDVVIPEFDANNQAPLFDHWQNPPDIWRLKLTQFGRLPYGYVEIDREALSCVDKLPKYERYSGIGADHSAFQYRMESSDWSCYQNLPHCLDLARSKDIVLCRTTGGESYALGIGPVLASEGEALQPKSLFVRARGLTGLTTTRSITIWGVEQLGWERVLMDPYPYPSTEMGVYGLELEVPSTYDETYSYRFLRDGKPMGSGAYRPLPSTNTMVELDIRVDGHCPIQGTHFTLSLEICDATLQSCGISDAMDVGGKIHCWNPTPDTATWPPY